MRTITDAYKSIYLEGSESPQHKELMRELAIEVAQIGQRIKMGKGRESDGDRLLTVAKTIDREYSSAKR